MPARLIARVVVDAVAACALLIVSSCTPTDHPASHGFERVSLASEAESTGVPQNAERGVALGQPRLSWERTLPWNDDTGPTYESGGHELPPRGPAAIGLAPGGNSVYVLDQLAGRILVVRPEGMPRTFAHVPAGATDLVGCPDGRMAVLSHAFRRVWILDAEGRTSGWLPVPSTLRRQRWLDWQQGRVWLVTGFQERVPLGSPSRPLSPGEALRAKREGAVVLADGRGVVSTLREGAIRIEVARKPGLGPSPKHPGRVVSLDRAFRSARLVGSFGSVVCLMGERLRRARPVEVTRSLLCLDVDRPHRRLEWSLGAPGSYVPVREVAVSRGRVAFMRPSDEGLRISVWEVEQ